MNLVERYFLLHRQNASYERQVQEVSCKSYIHRTGWTDVSVGKEMIFSYRNTYYTKEDFDEGLHTHDYYELLIYADGEVEYVNEDTVMRPEPLSAIWFVPGEMHTARLISNSQYERYVLYFSKDFFECGGKCTPILDFTHNRKAIIKIPTIKKTEFLRVLHNAIKAAKSDKSYAELLLKSYLIQVFEMLNAPELRSESGKIHMESMAKIKKYIDAEYPNISSIMEVAERFFYSREHLSRSFKQIYNVSISEYLRNRRVVESIKLLSSMTIAEAAYAVGFKYQSAYISAFKSYMGYLPSEYKRYWAKKEIKL